ncbi:MAG: YdeI/OmpD-associated family protein [Anaerolineae bacterium]
MKHEFKAVIQDAGSNGGAYVVVPFDVEQAYGTKRLKALATIDGVPYRGSVVRMGGPEHILIILKEIRQQIGKGPGDEVTITLEQDTEPRRVELAEDVDAALAADPQAAAAFRALAYTHQREYVQWIGEAKRADTRARRIAQMVEKLGATGD